ncbi:MAG: FAD-dependent oxidoreductase [Chloroflexota bacterium]
MTRLAYGGKDVAAIIGWGGVQVFDQSVDLVGLCAEYARAVQERSCGQCIPCRTGTRILAEAFERLRDGRGSAQDLEDIKVLSEVISQASMCDIGKRSPKVFLRLLEESGRTFKAALRRKKTRKSRHIFHSILTAPCMQACPIHLDIPKYVEEIRLGRFRESLDVVTSRLPLPGIVGRVCVRPCESNCRRGLIDGSIQIKHLKRFIADHALRHPEAAVLRPAIEAAAADPEDPRRGASRKVAIVGAGPSGLTCAYHLAKRDYKVTIFEMLSEPGGMAAVGIPDYRLPREIVQHEVKAIEDLGVDIIYGRALGPHFTLEDLERDGFEAIFIGMGCHCHKKLDVEGEEKNYAGYIPGVYFLRYINQGLLDEVPKGKKIVVVGGGNVAIDCVRTAFRVGFEESHLVYRRSRKEMPADSVEVDDAEAEGVQLHFLIAPKRIIGDNGRVTGLECLRMELGEPDASGRRKPVVVPGSEFVIECDVIVPAIGQEGDFNCMCNLPGVEVTRKGAIVVDENLMTKRKGVYAGGDCVTGPDVLIRACAHGRLVALAIDRYLGEGSTGPLDELADVRFLGHFKVFDPAEKIAHPGGTERTPFRHEPPLERRHDFREVDHGYTDSEAMAEASRCLRCYRVVTCAMPAKTAAKK